jgi:hypothetical protein
LVTKSANWEIAHQEYKAFRKRWGNKNIFEYGDKMLGSEDKIKSDWLKSIRGLTNRVSDEVLKEYQKEWEEVYKEVYPDKITEDVILNDKIR